MARDRTRHAQDKEVLKAPSVAPTSALLPYCLDCQKETKRQRILACLKTVAILLEKDEAYLPIFLRLERELEAESEKQEIIARARKYLPNQI